LKNRTTKQSEIIAAVATATPVTMVTPVPPAFCWKKRSEGEKTGGIPLRNPYCLSAASLRVLGRPPVFSAFGGFGPRPFGTFGAMPKVRPHFSPAYTSDQS